MTDQEKLAKFASFQNAARPLMKWLSENHHPHTKVIIDSTNAEVVEGRISWNTSEFVKD